MAPPAALKTPLVVEAQSPPPSPVAAVHSESPRQARVALLMLVVGSSLPPWWPFLVASYVRNAPTYRLIVVHTGVLPAGTNASAPHVTYAHIPLEALQQRFVSKLHAPPAQVEAKFASGKGLSDLKPFYGHIFDDMLAEAAYTHWGWVDWDLILGDMRAVVPEAMLWEHDALTFPGATLGFAWAGQLSILRNARAQRQLYEVVPHWLSLGLKTGSGEARQSGWEERHFLREVLKARPSMRILMHMAAQFDYKAQWLTWVPFDHFFDGGKVWRCAKLPLSRPGRPPLLVASHATWLRDVQQINTDPLGFQNRKDGRVCIRWDLESSPWRCCPHSSAVGYVAQGGSLSPLLLPYNNASEGVRTRLAALAKRAAVKPREASYDVCQEGAFFHAGLKPTGPRTAPSCASGTWALQDDVARFSGTLTLLNEECAGGGGLSGGAA